jgi:hypothetical protein
MTARTTMILNEFTTFHTSRLYCLKTRRKAIQKSALKVTHLDSGINHLSSNKTTYFNAATCKISVSATVYWRALLFRNVTQHLLACSLPATNHDIINLCLGIFEWSVTRYVCRTCYLLYLMLLHTQRPAWNEWSPSSVTQNFTSWLTST